MDPVTKPVVDAMVADDKAEVESGIVIDTHDEKALVRKIDRHMLPLMFFAYMLQFLDKTSLGYTAILGLQAGTHLKGDEYSWVSSAFYFGYLFASYPASLGFVKFPLGKFLSATFILWAVILACHGAVSNFAGLMAMRLLLGMLESTISPGMSLITGIWYKRSEHVSRHGAWFAGNGVASLFGGLLAYGIGHIDNSVATWRWLFIILGIITFSYGLILMIYLPDTPLTARFLTPQEREIANMRPQQETRSFKSHEWSRDQFIEALIDPKTWLLFIFIIAVCIPNGGLSSFSSLVIKGFGFSVFDTLLVSMPSAVFTLIWVVSSSFLASKLRRSRCLIMAALQLVSIVGSLMISQISSHHRWTRMAGTWFFGAFSAAIPMSLSLISSNVAGYTKKTTTSAILFIGYCTGNIIGPFLFFADEAPVYSSAWHGILASFGIAFVSIVTLRQVMDYENRRRNRVQGVKIDPEARNSSNLEHLTQLENETDWENQSFRYYL